MLQLVNANGLASARAETAASAGAVAVQPAQNVAAEGAGGFESTLSTQQQNAELDDKPTVEREAAAELLNVEPEVVLDTLVRPQGDLSMPNQAEQWLGSMLQQQSVELEARELTEGAGLEQDMQASAQFLAMPWANALPNPPTVNRGAERSASNALVRGASSVEPRDAAVATSGLTVDLRSAASGQALTESLSTLLGSHAVTAAQEVDFSLSSQTLSSTQAQGLSAVDAIGADAGQPSVPAAALMDGLNTQPSMPISTLKLHTPVAQYGQQMLESLRDSVELQLSQKIQNATIRLDPPELGSLEIFLSHDNGRLNVHLTASNSDVSRLLQQTGERLRQELVGQNFVQVNVQVSADTQGGGQRGQQAQSLLWADEAIRAGQDEPANAPDSTTATSSDVLVTV